MIDLIDRNALIKEIESVEYYGDDEEVSRICQLIRNAPTICKNAVESELQWIDEEIANIRTQTEKENNIELVVRESMLLNEKERLLQRIDSVN